MSHSWCADTVSCWALTRAWPGSELFQQLEMLWRRKQPVESSKRSHQQEWPERKMFVCTQGGVISSGERIWRLLGTADYFERNYVLG